MGTGRSGQEKEIPLLSLTSGNLKIKHMTQNRKEISSKILFGLNSYYFP